MTIKHLLMIIIHLYDIANQLELLSGEISLVTWTILLSFPGNSALERTVCFV